MNSRDHCLVSACGSNDTSCAVDVLEPSAERYFLFMVCGFSARSAEKPHTEIGEYHAAAGKSGLERGPQRSRVNHKRKDQGIL
jgi:hypothetical protein